MSIGIYVYLYICIYIAYVYMHICIYVRMYRCIYVFICIYVHMYICISATRPCGARACKLPKACPSGPSGCRVRRTKGAPPPPNLRPPCSPLRPLASLELTCKNLKKTLVFLRFLGVQGGLNYQLWEVFVSSWGHLGPKMVPYGPQTPPRRPKAVILEDLGFQNRGFWVPTCMILLLP